MIACSAAGPFEGGYKEARQIRIPRAFQLFQKHFGRWEAVAHCSVLGVVLCMPHEVVLQYALAH